MQSQQFQLHSQIEERHWWFVARRRILRELVQSVVGPNLNVRQPPHPDPLPGGEGDRKIVVDIGCGTGANLAAFADLYRCVGIDTSAEAIELARARFSGITFVCGHAPRDVARWLTRASVVLLTDVLEHVPDDRGLLESIVSACPPGTQLLLTVPADMRLWSPHDEAFGHFRRYDLDSFAKLWDGLPLRPRLASYFNSRLYPLVRIARRVSQWRGCTAGQANTDFNIPIQPVNRLLESIFAGERWCLRNAIDRDGDGYSRGVSLIAVLERLPSRATGLKTRKCCPTDSASIPLEAVHL
jgi:SAM-dependent methyltransferase